MLDLSIQEGAPKVKPVVLVVEDSPALSRLLRRSISAKLSCSIIECKSHAEAVAAISATPVTVAVTGLNLPDAPSGQILHLLSENKIPTILFSASVVEDLVHNYASRRLIDYIVKDGPGAVDRVAVTVCRVIDNGSTSVLVVDDMTAARSELVSFLRRQNFRVFAARTGRDALQILSENPGVEIVVTDYFMPDMDGFELTKQVRRRYASDRMRIIGVSASGDRHLSASFLKAGASDFIYRPFLPEELQCRIDNNVETLLQLKRLRYLAERDPLTSLYNRRAFFERAEAHLRSLTLAQAGGKTGAVAIVDIDHFKSINDNYGHEIGDIVLKTLAATFQELSHSEEVVTSRLGGEEFAFLMRNHTLAQGTSILERMLSGIREIRFASTKGDFTVTASAGIVEIEVGESLDNQLNAADQMLYLAKKLGRNQICSNLLFRPSE
ncbi:MAG: diguanylate cyclase [Rhizobium sp.]|nr:diguanylate cyclase [Rhizobium sp.]